MTDSALSLVDPIVESDESPGQELGTVPGETSRVIERNRGEKWECLEPHKRMFAIEYMRTMSHVMAAKNIGRAGDGLRYLRDPLVLALISDLQEEYHQTNIITEYWIQAKLMELLPRVMGEEEIPIVLANGLEMTAKKFHASESKAVIDALGNSLTRENGININVSGKVTHSADTVSIKDISTLYERIAQDSTAPVSLLPVIEGEVVENQ